VTRPAIASLSGAELRELFAAGTAWLGRHKDRVDAVNVFPVPDGDTGRNMHHTIRMAVEEAERDSSESAAGVLAAMSHGSLYEGKGNSGVILSQIIAGFARGVGDAATIGPELFATSLEQASLSAYKSVQEPTEGTILTVIRDVSAAVRQAANNGGDITALVEAAVGEAKASVERTPTLLPKLAEAGVVDAGGLGLSVIFEGFLRHLWGETLDEVVPVALEAPRQDWLADTAARHQVEDSLYGYCTEMLVSSSGFDVESFRERVIELGDSVIVVGDPDLVRVHIHTDDPGAALTLGTEVGHLLQVKVDNIRAQAEHFVDMHKANPGLANELIQVPSLSTVAVVAGEGMGHVFKSVGCTRTILGGPTMNVTPREIVAAVDECPSQDVAVLPNDKNIIFAAEQARKLTKKWLHVIPTRSMPQGIAALLPTNPEETDPEVTLSGMKQALNSVRTIEVTRAVRSTNIEGQKVATGDFIAIVDEQLKLTTFSPEEAVLGSLDGLSGAGTVVTLYYGAGTRKGAAEGLARNIRERFSSYEVEVVYGGQPHYSYIVSVE